MTFEPEAGAASRPSHAGGRYENFAELRAEHLRLRESFSETVRGPAAPRASSELREFLTRAQKTGAVLADPNVRKAAQGILYYWNAELACLDDARKEDFVPIILAPPDLSALRDAERATAETEPAMQDSKADQRTLIRLAATARQWRDSGKQSGYLLAGKTITEAARFSDKDPNLAEFIRASQKASERAARIRWFAMITAGSVSALLVMLAFSYALWQLPVYRDHWIAELKVNQTATPVRQASILKWLGRLQPFLPPYELTGLVEITDVSLPGLILNAPNFSEVDFSRVEFPHAELTAVSFSGSRFSFNGPVSGSNDFREASLQRAQFKGARIASTSFAGANLYRAVFDRAVLCDVDFSGANLRSTSFWAVALNKQTERLLRNAAWWFAVGWPWSEIEKLAFPHQDQANSAGNDKAIAALLKASSGFGGDIDVPTKLIPLTKPATLERALALNDMAWTYAIWGIDTAGPGKPSDPCSAEGIPTNARDAAEQAVCTVSRLNALGEKKGAYVDLLSSLRDTLAYIRMQNREMREALDVFKEIARDQPQFLDSGETSFRYAIAQYAASNEAEKAEALQRFKSAVGDKGYQPTHELQTLKDYIFPVKEFTEALRASTDRLWPPVPNQTSCPG